MMLEKDEFLKKYSISTEEFEKANISFEDLIKIHADYISKYTDYDDAGANLVRILLRFDAVHSVKYRIKEPEHLIEKIIRKRAENPKRVIDINNYQKQIQDIIGIRILHLFKSDWLFIHTQLNSTFKQNSKPEANIRKGDVETLFKSNGCKIKVHKAGYRSVHYLIISEPTLKAYISEVQVRTIFEEAWSEIDHKVRYPYFTDNETVNEFLKIFNRLAGSADEMGEFVTILKRESLLNQKILAERQQEIEKLKEQVNNSQLDKKTKDNLSGGLDSLKTIDRWKELDSTRAKMMNYIKPYNFVDLSKIIAETVPISSLNWLKTIEDDLMRLKIDDFEKIKNSHTINVRQSDAKKNIEMKRDEAAKKESSKTVPAEKILKIDPEKKDS